MGMSLKPSCKSVTAILPVRTGVAPLSVTRCLASDTLDITKDFLVHLRVINYLT